MRGWLRLQRSAIPGQPVRPIRPPAARHLAVLGQPVPALAVAITDGKAVFGQRHRRIDNAQDVRRSAEHISRRSTTQRGGLESTAPRRDVVLFRAKHVQRLADTRQIDGVTTEDHSVLLRERMEACHCERSEAILS